MALNFDQQFELSIELDSEIYIGATDHIFRCDFRILVKTEYLRQHVCDDRDRI